MAKGFGELQSLRDELRRRAREDALERARREAAAAEAAREAGLFRAAVSDAVPLPASGRVIHPPPRRVLLPRQRELDERAALAASLSDEIDIERLLDTDDRLSYRRPELGPDVVRRLRRGEWVIQEQIDLHGLRVVEARDALASFLAQAIRRELRCVRVIHGKGLGSAGREPVLKGKVLRWLVQRDEVLAFCQARPTDGGSGALIALLRGH